MEEKSKKISKKWIVLIVSIAIIAYWIINNLNQVGTLIDNIIYIVFPFILGGFLAFILNIPMTFFEKKILKLCYKKKTKLNSKLARIISIIIAFALCTLVIIFVVNLIVPKLVDVFNLLIDNIPYYKNEIKKVFENFGMDMTNLNEFMEQTNFDLEQIKEQIVHQIPNVLSSSLSLLLKIINGVTTFIVSLVFAIYILMDKEKLITQIKKIIKVYFNKNTSNQIINIGRIINKTFKNYFTVQCLEATILGTLCVIGMLILRIPYAVPIGILVGVTALIPIFGAFIGAIVGAILIFAVNPIKVITFIIFIIVLQEIEGKLIYPKVVGGSIGLPGIWVLFAVTIGGRIGGILGMLLSVPTMTVIYTLLKNDVNKKYIE